MSWWSVGDGTDQVVGDDSADAAKKALRELGMPTPEQMLNALAGAVNAGLTLRRADGETIDSDQAAADAAMTEKLRAGVDSITEAYQRAFERNPSLKEVVQSFVFVLGHKPERFLSIEGAGVDDITSD